MDHKEGWVQIIDVFKLWCWRIPLRVPWTARRSNQSILMEINPEYSLEGLMLKLKLQYFGHLMQTADSLEKTLMLGKTEGKRRGGDRGWGGWMASLPRWTWIWANSGRQQRQRNPAHSSPWSCKRVRRDLTTEHQQQMRTNYTAQRSLVRALWWPEQQDNLKKSGYMHMWGWFTCWIAETNTSLESNCTPIKKKFFFKEYPKLWGRNKLVVGSLCRCQPAHAVRERVGGKR